MRSRNLLLVAALAVTPLVLTGCSGSGRPVEQQTVAPVTGVATATATSTPTGTAPDAAVAGAQSRFDAANQALAAKNSDADDEAIVGALVSAGFTKDAMQITPDSTTIGRKADSIEVSVLVGQTCLLGEFRGATYVGATAPVLSTGHCLIGATRAIDF